MIDQAVMDRLQALVGKTVTLRYVTYGRPEELIGDLREVTPFSNVLVAGTGVPFVGYGCGIQSIHWDGEQIYSNPLIEDDYDLRADDATDAVLARTFGLAIADAHRKRRKEYEDDFKKQTEKRDAAAREKSEALVDAGGLLVRSELRDEWIEYARKNTKDGYSAACIEATIRAMKVLTDGGTPKEAETEACGKGADGLTGFMMGIVAQGVSYYHQRGDEFKGYWNRQYMSEEEAAKAEGVVNPAILTIRSKD